LFSPIYYAYVRVSLDLLCFQQLQSLLSLAVRELAQIIQKCHVLPVQAHP